jgi:hypothetical protein
MLARNPTPTAVTTYARVGSHVVRLTVNMKCPHCTRPLQATDVEVDFGDVRLICAGCHKDVLTIEAAS